MDKSYKNIKNFWFKNFYKNINFFFSEQLQSASNHILNFQYILINNFYFFLQLFEKRFSKIKP